MVVIATVLLARRSLVRHRRTVFTMALLIGVGGGLILALIAAADRAASAYDRLLADIDAPDVVVVGAGPWVAARAAVVDSELVLLTDTKGVSIAPDRSVTGNCYTGPGEVTLTSVRTTSGEPARLSRLVTGRRVAEGSGSEVTVPMVTARRAGLEIGDTLRLDSNCGSYDSTRLLTEVVVVGMTVGILDSHAISGAATRSEQVEADPVLLAAMREPLADQVTMLWEPEELGNEVVLDLSAHAGEVRSGLRAEADWLELLAGLGATIAAIVLGALLIDHIHWVGGTDQEILRSLGATRTDLVAWLTLHALGLAAGAGAAAALVVGIVAPLLPRGQADLIDADVRWIPWAWALAGGGAVFGVTAALGAVATIRPTGARARTRVAAPSPARVGSVGWLGLRPALVLGLRFAYKPAVGAAGRGGTGRPALVGLLGATLAFVSATTFRASADDLRSSPELLGVNWDAGTEIGATAADRDAVANALDDVADIRWGFAIWYPELEARIPAGPALLLQTGDHGPRGLEPAIIAGRAPQGTGEIALEPGAAEQLGLTVGDRFDIEVDHPFNRLAEAAGLAPPVTRVGTLELVGLVVLPFPSTPETLVALMSNVGSAELAAGLDARVVTDIIAAAPTDLPEDLADLLAAARRADPETLVPRPQFVFVDAGGDVERANAILAELADGGHVAPPQFDTPFSEEQLEQTGVDVRSVGTIPRVLSQAVLVTAVVLLVHMVAVTARAHRRDLAILRALGARRRLLGAVIRWQAVTAVGGALVVGVPLGVAIGRQLWLRYVDDLDVVPRAVTPWVELSLFAALAVGSTVAVGTAVAATTLQTSRVDLHWRSPA